MDRRASHAEPRIADIEGMNADASTSAAGALRFDGSELTYNGASLALCSFARALLTAYTDQRRWTLCAASVSTHNGQAMHWHADEAGQ